MEMTDLGLAIATIKAYKDYIDRPIDISDEDRSDLLMVARRYDLEMEKRNLYNV